MELYNRSFYLEQQELSKQSALRIVPLLMKHLQPRSVVDVGCGVGTWLSIFKQFGVDHIVGIDGSYVRKDMLHIEEEQFIEHDLSETFHGDGEYDLVISLEVAEHIPPSNCDTYLDTLTKLGKTVLFSAAIPSQGGVGHVNEQWPDYWIQKFKSRGYTVIDVLRPMIWEEIESAFWYNQNMMLFVEDQYLRSNDQLQSLQRLNSFEGVSLVHPELYLKMLVQYQNIFNQLFASQRYDIIIQCKQLDIPVVNYYVGRAYKALGQFSEGLTYLQKYLDSSDQSFELSALFHIGELYFTNNHANEALDYFMKCLERTNGNHKLANEYIQRMKEEV